MGAMQGSVQCPTCDDEWECSHFDHRSNGVRVGTQVMVNLSNGVRCQGLNSSNGARVGTQVLITNSPGYQPAVSGFGLES